MQNEIEQFYDESDEWGRFDRHRIEFDITKRYLDTYLAEKGMSVFDIGGGPGRYSIYLAEKGHRVTLLDLSGKNVEKAREKAVEAGVELDGYIHGNALELGECGEYDAVLLMGPLYHLTKKTDRETAVREALRVLKPGGILIAAFISSYAIIQDHLSWLTPFESAEELLGYLEDGENEAGTGFTSAYFMKPEEAEGLMGAFGLKELSFACVENILASKEQEIMRLPEEEYQKWLEIGWKLSRNPAVYGAGCHYLYIGQK